MFTIVLIRLGLGLSKDAVDFCTRVLFIYCLFRVPLGLKL